MRTKIIRLSCRASVKYFSVPIKVNPREKDAPAWKLIPGNRCVAASETTINEESQGSVLSTATTESEKVKVKNRRMEINFDPDEGPFTVDKIAEYEWPLDRKGETFMIQEQISQYLGVKSFKRKYPDLKRRMVDMEERNYLRENVLVSEAMCDMGKVFCLFFCEFSKENIASMASLDVRGLSPLGARENKLIREFFSGKIAPTHQFTTLRI